MRTFNYWFRTPGILVLSLLVLLGILIAGAVPVLGGGAPRGWNQERYLECTEVNGDVTYYSNQFLKAVERPAKVGDRISRSGEGIRTNNGSSATLTVDNGIGTTKLAENTNLQVKNLGRGRNGASSTQLAMNRGRVRAKVRTFTNPQSSFSIQTPTGVAGVRGTEFVVVVEPNGGTRISTLEGIVAVSGQNQTEEVKSGYFSTIDPGQPPTIPTLASANLKVSFQLLPAPDNGKVRVVGVVNPINLVFVEEEALDVSATGAFDTIVSVPANGRLKLIVRNPLGEEQVYELVVFSPEQG